MATRTKHYEAELKDLDHLLQIIESEMGPDAQLETMEYNKGGIMGLGGKKMIAITATVEVNPQRIGSGIRRTIKLDANWSTGSPEDLAAAGMLKQPEPEDNLLNLSKRRSAIPMGGGIVNEVERAARRKQAPTPEPAQELKEAEFRSAAIAPTETPVEGIIVEQEVVEIVDDNAYTTSEPEVVVAVIPESLIEAEAQTGPVEAEAELLVAAALEDIEVAAPVQEAAEEWTAAHVTPADPRMPTVDDEPDHLDEFAASVREIREAMARLGGLEPRPGGPALSPPGPAEFDIAAAMGSAFAVLRRDVFNRLVDWNIRSTDALALIEQAARHYGRDAEPSEDGLFNLAVIEMLRPVRNAPGLRAVPGQRHVMAIVGGTGSGKTSLAAKLAARYAYEKDQRVALISMDTYRIAAVDQLRTFAEIMGFPLEIAYTPEEFARLADSMDADLIIVDTAGRSPLNLRQLDELQTGFAKRLPDEVHIALPATLRYDDLALTLEAFAPLQPSAAIVTKLDETRSLGMLHNLSQLGGPPLSFYSTGQAIPEDLYEAQPGFLIGWADSLGFGT
ncbi:MAG: hypothetical protein M3R04_06725 [bacterium]|nr:hypothetical protein [bacterium]